jgi:flagellin-like hook-associated protein FlgL
LGLKEARVSGAAESSEGSEAARQALLAKLAQAWNGLGLRDLEGVALEGGAASGFSLGQAQILASAAGAVVVQGLTAAVASGRALKVHTGVYADANGNWTDDRELASALQLDEVVMSFANDGTVKYTAALLGGNTYVSDSYVVTGDRAYGMTTVDAFEMGTLGGITFAGLGMSSAKVDGSFRGRGGTLASARADLLRQIHEAWEDEYSFVGQRLKYQNAVAYHGVSWAGVTAQNASNAGLKIDPGTGQVTAGVLTVHTGVWVQSGTGTFTSSKSVADALNAKGGAFREMVFTIQSGATATEYLIQLNGKDIDPFGSWTAQEARFDVTADLDGPGTALTNYVEAYLNSFAGAHGRLWMAPETGPTSFFAPTAAEVDSPQKSQASYGIPSTLTVTAEIGGKTVELETGAVSSLDRNATTLGTLAALAGKGLSSALTAAQKAAAAAGYAGSGRIRTLAATRQAALTQESQIALTGETETFVSGVLEKVAASGSYKFGDYSLSTSSNIGLNSVQLRALGLAGVDLAKLHLAVPSVSASGSASASSASAKADLVANLNQLWAALGLNARSSLTVLPGTTAGYALLTGAAAMASAAPGAVTGYPPSFGKLDEGQSLTVHTGVYADSKGNWTDDSGVAAALGLKEVSYLVENRRLTWYKQSASFRSSALVSGGLTVSSAVANELSLGNIPVPATFLKASARVRASAHTSAMASALLYASAQLAWSAKYGGAFAEIGYDTGPNNLDAISDLSYVKVREGGNLSILDGSGAGAEILLGQTLEVRSGVYHDAYGNWTDDGEIAAAFGMAEYVYEIQRTGANEYTWKRDGAVMGAGLALTLQEIGHEIAFDATAVLTYAQSGMGVSGKLGRGAPAPGGLAAPSAADLEANKKGLVPSPPGPNFSGQLSNGAANAQLSVTPSVSGLAPLTGLVGSATSMDQLAAALNTHFAGALAGLQAQAALAGFSGAGRVAYAANTPPAAAVTLPDVDGLSVRNVYRQGTPDVTTDTQGLIGLGRRGVLVASAGTASANAQGVSNFGALALASAINHNPDSMFWAMVQSADSRGRAADMVYVFAREGGDFNGLLADKAAGPDLASRAGLAAVLFEDVGAARITGSAASFTLGGLDWGAMKAVQGRTSLGNESWNAVVEGRDAGAERDVWIANDGEIATPGLYEGVIKGMGRDGFAEIQNASDGAWAGADIRTQSSAQKALGAVDGAIKAKDRIRAALGAAQNRLENTMANLSMQLESLQAAESRISELDVAAEMTAFTGANILAQAATSMLAQANSLGSLALTLIRG